MKSSKTPRLRTKVEILRLADYFLNKFVVTYWDELLFKEDDLDKIYEVIKILEIKMRQNNEKA